MIRIGRSPRRLLGSVMLVALGAISEAGAIRSGDDSRFSKDFQPTGRVSSRGSSDDARMPAAFRAYLEGGPKLWARVVPRTPAGLSLRADSSGMLPDTPLVSFLRWKRDRNVVRFDRFHPRVGPMLDTDRIARTPVLPPPRAEPPPPLTPPSPLLLPPPNVNVPEPSTWMSAGLLAGLAILSGRRRRSTQGASAS